MQLVCSLLKSIIIVTSFSFLCVERGSHNRENGEALVIEKTVSSKLRRGFPVCYGLRFPFSEIISTQLSL